MSIYPLCPCCGVRKSVSEFHGSMCDECEQVELNREFDKLALPVEESHKLFFKLLEESK
jgi:hypothetical protein